MGYIKYNPEIIRNSSTGANPVCPKSVDRAVVNHMGDSERIAEKFVASKYAGRVIEPRNRYKVVVKPMPYVDAEGSNDRDKQRSSLLIHRGQRTWHAYKWRIAEDGRSDCFPPNTTGNRLPGINKARL